MEVCQLILNTSRRVGNQISTKTLERVKEYQESIDQALRKVIQARKRDLDSIVFVYHCTIPPDQTRINYRDISMDQARADYEEILGFHAAATLATNPNTLWLLVTDQCFQPQIQNQKQLEEEDWEHFSIKCNK